MGGSVKYLTDGQSAQVIRVAKVRYKHLKWCVRIMGRAGNFFKDCVQQNVQVYPFLAQAFHCDTVTADRVKQGKFELIVRGIQVDQKIVYFIKDIVGTGVMAVNLVNDHNDFQISFQSLFEDKPGLRQRPFRGIYQKNRSVGHGKRPFNLSPKIRVAGSIDDIDPNILP